jgi:hypothetical protein
LELFATFERQIVDHFGALLGVAFENLVEECTEGFLFGLVEVDHHADIQQGNLNC